MHSAGTLLSQLVFGVGALQGAVHVLGRMGTPAPSAPYGQDRHPLFLGSCMHGNRNVDIPLLFPSSQ